LSTDLRDVLRRRKPERRRIQLKVRHRDELVAPEDVAVSGRALLMPDTNVYIGAAAGTLPPLVQSFVERAFVPLLGLPG
jgi:hypothetical protein